MYNDFRVSWLSFLVLRPIVVQTDAYYFRFSLPLQVTDHVCLVLECDSDISYCMDLASVATHFLFRLLQRFSFLLPATECLLFFGCHVPGFWIFPKLSLADLIFFSPSNVGSHRVNFIYIQPVELHFLHAFTSNSPPDMSSTQATSAIAAGLGFVSITALIIITVALCLTRKHRGQTRERGGSVTTPVIDICRLARSSVERQSRVTEPHRPPEAYLSTWQSSSSIRVVSIHEDALRRPGLHRLSGYVISAVDLEAQSWKPTTEKRNGKAEPSRPLSVELPISPPPSYSQIDRSVLVSVP
ncbi:hypothetical protein F5888DRAFT_771391 [Russula emetica]|nr:hypothetical protein F5888DRAFT_771391 [Russula emetica]